jgi:hypothetical protein
MKGREMRTAQVVHVYPTAIWIESGWCGERRVMLQHEGCEPFAYATFGYDYRYTSNASTWEAARRVALSLGATEPIEQKGAPWGLLQATVPWWKRLLGSSHK